MTDRIEVHQSQLAKFELCGEAYRRHYVEREPDLPGTAALRGSGVHGAAQVNHRQKKKSGVDLPKKDLIDAAVASFEEKKSKEGFRLTPDEQSIGLKPTIARTLDSVTALTGLYADKVAPTIQPDLVEEKIIVELPNVAVDLAGTIDVSTVQGRLKDFKTSARSKSQKDADESNQLTLYEYLYEKKTGKKPTGIDLDVLVDLKSGPKHQVLSTTRTEADRRALFNRINVMIRARQAGIYAPAGVGSWICSPKWCGYWDTCPYVNSQRMAAAAKGEE
jgi:hypothetical protein